MAKTYCECSECGYLIQVESTQCVNCGKERSATAIKEQPVLRVPGEDAVANTQPLPVNPASTGAVDELLLDELRSLRRMQSHQGRSLLRWMKVQTLILGLTGLFVTIIILLAYIAITGPIG
jgi:hypothetical protein